jgi:hypothetical protein
VGRPASQRAGQRARRRKHPALSALDGFIWLAAAAAGLSLGYLLYVILTGAAAQPDQQVRFRSAAAIFDYLTWLLALAVFGRYWREEAVSYWVGAAGLAFLIGFPVLFGNTFPEEIRASVSSPLHWNLERISDRLSATGIGLLILAFLRLVVGRIVRLSLGAGRPEGAITPAAAPPTEMVRPSLLRRCWELSECRPAFRQACPRFTEQVSCWKRRSGCYCDRELAARLLGASGLGHRGDLQEELTSLSDRAEQRARESLAFTARRAREKKTRTADLCAQCPVYLDHQRYKYRFLTWVVYPATFALVCLLLPALKAAYGWAYMTLGELASKLQFMTPSEEALKKPFSPGQPAGDTVFVVLIGLLLLSFFLQAVEYFVFRLKW